MESFIKGWKEKNNLPGEIEGKQFMANTTLSITIH